MSHYLHDDNKNRIEGMSKEEIYSLLAEAIQEGQLPEVDQDTAFVTMIKSIIDGKAYKIGFCTKAKYNELEAQGKLVRDALYIITDDDSYTSLVAAINQLTEDIGSLREGIGHIQSSIETINERLDDLGFEEGSFAIASIIAATTNSIKKQGKYVIASLGAAGQSVDMTDSILIPTKFRPKANTTINAEIIVMVSGTPTYYTTCKVSTNGLITYENGSAITNCISLTIQNAGWEIN